jgi:type II secretory pathway pseudopilin PulG
MIAKHRSRNPSAHGRAQRGFLLVELIVYLGLVAMLAIYANKKLVAEAEESLAIGAGVYLQAVSSAAQRHVLMNYSAYANNTPVPGVAVLLQPMVPELIALGRLNSGFPGGADQMPTRQTALVTVTRSAACPGSGCQVMALVCTTTPVSLGSGTPRFDLASTMVTAQNGSGGQSLYGTGGATVVGPALSQANPVGAVEGIVCGSGLVDAGMYSNFLTLADGRDPNFQGGLTVTGSTNFSGTTTVGGPFTASSTAALNGTTTVGGCITLSTVSGRAGFGCANPSDLPAGYAGGVRSVDVVASGAIVASNNPSTFTGANGNYAYLGVNGGVGEVRTSGRAQADRLVPAGAYPIGSACSAADEGAIARDAAGTGLITCRTGLWRSLATFAAAGSACSPNGAIADDGTGSRLLCMGGIYQPMSNLWAAGTPGAACVNQGTVAYDALSNNELLLCKTNPAGGSARYMRARDVTSNLVFVQSYEVTDNSVGSGTVTKPTCSPASGMSATSVIQLIPKVYSSGDGGVAAYAVDTGAAWSIYLRNGNNAALTGTPSARAIANVYCFFA